MATAGILIGLLYYRGVSNTLMIPHQQRSPPLLSPLQSLRMNLLWRWSLLMMDRLGFPRKVWLHLHYSIDRSQCLESSISTVVQPKTTMKCQHRTIKIKSYGNECKMDYLPLAILGHLDFDWLHYRSVGRTLALLPQDSLNWLGISFLQQCRGTSYLVLFG